MRFKAKKVYGTYKTAKCPFCDRQATNKNEQGLDVCHQHTKSLFDDIKCTCGSWLEIRTGKFGPYFNCMNCGNLNMGRAMEIKAITMKDKPKVVEKPTERQSIYQRPRETNKRKEITITTDDVDYFD